MIPVPQSRTVLPCLMPVLMIAALGGCGKSDTKLPTDAKAGGQILERSVTDDMIPYDTLRSQAPLAKQSGSAGDGSGGSLEEAGSGGAGSGEDASGEETPTPAAE